MKKNIFLSILAFLALALPALAEVPKQVEPVEGTKDFSFYGVHFRMTREQVQKLMETDAKGREAVKPSHGIMFLNFAYDYSGRLMEIRAAYQRPGDPLAEEGLRRALREKFVRPISGEYRNISATLDEFSNRAAIILVLTSLDIREEVINHFREEALKKLE